MMFLPGRFMTVKAPITFPENTCRDSSKKLSTVAVAIIVQARLPRPKYRIFDVPTVLALNSILAHNATHIISGNTMSGHSFIRQLSALGRVSRSLQELHPPIFLAPLLASNPQPLHLHQRSSFSTTAVLSVRANKKRDGNPHRGESALRRTGLRYGMGMSKQPLPQPVPKQTKIKGNPDHGLWGFFNKKRTALSTLSEDNERGMLLFSRTV